MLKLPHQFLKQNTARTATSFEAQIQNVILSRPNFFQRTSEVGWRNFETKAFESPIFQRFGDFQ